MIPARVVLYFLSFSGFLVSFMMRTDINIAMVAMVKLPSTSNNETVAVTSQCYTMTNASHTENTTVVRPEVHSIADAADRLRIAWLFFSCFSYYIPAIISRNHLFPREKEREKEKGRRAFIDQRWIISFLFSFFVGIFFREAFFLYE